jgi:type I restriction enzyme M protein
LFIERTKQLLKDGGVAGIILPSSILSNTGIYTKTREILLCYFEIIAIAELGSNTFMATGTNTVTLFLRRRNNYEHINIKASVERFTTNLQDVTINGIEKPIAKYVAHVWEGIGYADYLTLLQKQPNDAIATHELYQDYCKKISGKNEQEKWNAIIALEQEKLLYFILAYPQQIVLVKTGDKNEEKAFLGYEFSNRRGSEGIHPMQRGKTIDQCTKLFDPETFENPEKASTYIYHAFQGIHNTPIAESLQENITRHRLVNMLTFDRVEFEKGISLALKKKVRFEDIWVIDNLESLSAVAELKKGTSITKDKTIEGDIPVIAGGQEPAYFHNQSNREGNIITVSASGAYAGFVNYFNSPIFASDCNTIKSKDESIISTKLIYLYLKTGLI